MKKLTILCLIAVFLLSACSNPQTPGTPAAQENPQQQAPSQQQPAATEAVSATATTAVTPTPIGPLFDQSGVQFNLPACLASGASVSQVAEQPLDPNMPGFEYYPAHRLIQFSGYPISGAFFEPQIRIYPIVDYMRMNTAIVDLSSQLNGLLTSQSTTLPQSIPFLPIVNAAQVFHAREGYLNFQNGMGIGFLTEYAQYTAPANNHDLFYTFQGLTADGKYWVSAILPVNAVFLPATYDSTEVPPNGVAVPQMTDPDFVNAMQGYYNQVTALMTSAADGDYTPGIDCVTSFLQALNVKN